MWTEPRSVFELLWQDPGVERLPHPAAFDWSDPALDAQASGRYGMYVLMRVVGDHEASINGTGRLGVYGPRPHDAAGLATQVHAAVLPLAPQASLAAVRQAIDDLVLDFVEEPDDNSFGSERRGESQLEGPLQARDIADGTPSFRFGRNELASGWRAEIAMDRVKLSEGRFHVTAYMQANGTVQADDHDHNQTLLIKHVTALFVRHGITPSFQGLQVLERKTHCGT